MGCAWKAPPPPPPRRPPPPPPLRSPRHTTLCAGGNSSGKSSSSGSSPSSSSRRHACGGGQQRLPGMRRRRRGSWCSLRKPLLGRCPPYATLAVSAPPSLPLPLGPPLPVPSPHPWAPPCTPSLPPFTPECPHSSRGPFATASAARLGRVPCPLCGWHGQWGSPRLPPWAPPPQQEHGSPRCSLWAAVCSLGLLDAGVHALLGPVTPSWCTPLHLSAAAAACQLAPPVQPLPLWACQPHAPLPHQATCPVESTASVSPFV